ncbi:MAG TPA: hypothetical protein PKK97_00185, partial [Thauera aminoaromatica]|nr:hypothetical protein [Thauera aminoaromatica]
MIGLIGKTSSPPVASLSRASAPPALSSDSQPRRASHAIGNECRSARRAQASPVAASCLRTDLLDRRT